MRLSIVAAAALATAAGLYMAKQFAAEGRNIDERTAYWEKEISAFLKPGSSKEEIDTFAKSHGEQLHCYQNYNHEDLCDFTDSRSSGGSSSRPMKLALIFKINVGKLVSHELTPALASAPQ